MPKGGNNTNKNKKYMRKNIECNILVVGKNHNLIS
jgi:hypothetical protein